MTHFEALLRQKTRTPQDGDKFTDFWVDLMKILFFEKNILKIEPNVLL